MAGGHVDIGLCGGSMGGTQGGPACRVLRVDLDLPIEDVAMGGARLLHVTAFAGGALIGAAFLPAPVDPFPGSLLAEELGRRFAESLHRARLGATLQQASPTVRARGLPSATIVVCTRDRPQALSRCLPSLAELTDPVLDVVVVDNAGTPDPGTRRLVEARGMRYVHEPVPGLSRARNRGVAVARGDVLLFTDDDIEVSPRWAGRLLACFDDPLVMAATGFVMPAVLDTAAGVTFERVSSFSRGTRRFVLDGSTTSPFHAARLGAGASMALRADFVRSIGGFPEELGPGAPTGSADDHYAFYRVLAAGFRAVYDPSALAYHHHRSHDAELERVLRNYTMGASAYLLHAARRDRDPGTALVGGRFLLRYVGVRALRTALGREGALPAHLARAELSGVAAAPRAYRAARRTVADRPVLPAPTPLRPPAGWLDAPAPTVAVASELPRLSVVIPTRGRRERLLRLLRALEAQRYPDDRLEVVVCVDGDIDGSAAAAEALPTRRMRRVVALDAPAGSPDHGNGPAAARNRACGAATGDVLLFLDDDVDPVGEEALLAHGRRQAAEPAAVAGPCIPDLWNVDGVFAQQVRNWGIDHARRLARDGPLGFSDVSTGNLSLPRAVFLDLGGFAPLPRREDWELGYRIAKAGIPIHAGLDAAVVHDADVRVPNAVRDRRREGAGDLMFVRRHPEIYGWLPLSWWEEMGRRVRRPVTMLLLDPARFDRLIATGIRVLPLVERAGMRAEYVGALSALNILSYWAGVAEAAGGEEAWHSLRAEARAAVPAHPALDLATDRWEPPAAGTAAQVQVLYRGLALGQAPLRWGRLPWTAAAFLRAVADRFSADALHAEVLGPDE